MDYRLKIFESVATTLSFSATAKIFGITQPSVTQNIAALESECGVELFCRSGKKTTLTRAGILFLQRVKVILKEYESISLEMQAISSGAHGDFKIAMPAAFYYGIYPKITAEYISLSPKATFTAVIADNKEINKLIEQKKVNAGFLFGSTDALFTDTLIPAGYSGGRNSVNIEELKILLYEGDSATSEDINSLMQSNGIDYTKLSCTTTAQDPYTALQIILRYAQKERDGKSPLVGFFRESFVAEALKEGAVERVNIAELKSPFPQREYILKEPDDTKIPGFRKFITSLINSI